MRRSFSLQHHTEYHTVDKGDQYNSKSKLKLKLKYVYYHVILGQKYGTIGKEDIPNE